MKRLRKLFKGSYGNIWTVSRTQNGSFQACISVIKWNYSLRKFDSLSLERLCAYFVKRGFKGLYFVTLSIEKQVVYGAVC